MRLVSRIDFGKSCNPPISRQAVNDAVARGALDVIEQDGKKYIDLDSYKSVQYLTMRTSQRRNGKLQNDGDRKPVQIGNVPEINNPDVKKTARIELPRTDPTDAEKDVEEYNQAKKEKLREEVKKLKLARAYRRGRLVDREKVYNSVYLFLDRILSNLERLADTYLSDVAGQIISDGQLTPEIRQKWIDSVLEQIDNAKNDTTKKLKTITDEQAK